jgi:surface protein
MLMRRRYYGGSSADAFTITATFTEETTFTFPASGTNNLTIDWGDDTTESVTTASPSHTYEAGTYIIKATGTMTAFAFDNSSSAKYVTSIVTGGSVLNTTTLARFVNGCINMTSCDISGLDTSSVTSMYRMFYNCKSLTSLDLSSFNTSSVTTMYQMFGNCSSLITLDLSNFDTSAVTTIYWIFYNCSSLNTLDVSGFDTSSITSMERILYGCSSLTTLDLSSFDTSSVTTMERMLYNCSSLTDIIGIESFNVAKVTSFSGMLYNITLPTSRYDAILNQNTGWASQTLQDGSLQTSDSMDFGNSTYTSTDSDVVSGRSIIQDTYNWAISDGGAAA